MRPQPSNAPQLPTGQPSARTWSGRWESNPRHSAWEADVLPLNYARKLVVFQLLSTTVAHFLSHPAPSVPCGATHTKPAAILSIAAFSSDGKGGRIGPSLFRASHDRRTLEPPLAIGPVLCTSKLRDAVASAAMLTWRQHSAQSSPTRKPVAAARAHLIEKIRTGVAHPHGAAWLDVAPVFKTIARAGLREPIALNFRTV